MFVAARQLADVLLRRMGAHAGAPAPGSPPRSPPPSAPATPGESPATAAALGAYPNPSPKARAPGAAGAARPGAAANPADPVGPGAPAQAGGEQARSDLAAGLALVEALGAAGAPPRAHEYAGALVEVLFRCALHYRHPQGHVRYSESVVRCQGGTRRGSAYSDCAAGTKPPAS